MRGLTRALGVATVAAVFAAVGAAPVAAEVPAKPTFTKDIAPIFQEKCEACHRHGLDRPDVARDLRRIASVGALDQDARVDASDAAVAHRQDRRHPGIQERPLAQRRPDRDDRPLGRPGRREGRRRRTCPPPKQWPDEQGWNFAKLFGQTEPDLIVKSTPWTQKAGQNDAWWKPTVDTGLTEDRWVRAIEIRPGTVKGRKITHHAIARLQQDETDPLDPEPRSGWPSDCRHVHGMGRRQAGRDHAAEQRQADAARREDHLGHPLLERRRRHHRPTPSSASTSTRRARSRSTARCST